MTVLELSLGNGCGTVFGYVKQGIDVGTSIANDLSGPLGVGKGDIHAGLCVVDRIEGSTVEYSLVVPLAHSGESIVGKDEDVFEC